METIFPVKFKGKLNIDQIERFVDVCMEFAAEIKTDVTFVRGRKEREGCSNCNLPHVSKSEGITCEAQLNAFIEWHDNLSIEELAWYEGRYLEIFKSI